MGEGHVWVADYANNRVLEFTEAGQQIRELTGNQVNSVALDGKGHVWVADSTIIKEYGSSNRRCWKSANPAKDLVNCRTPRASQSARRPKSWSQKTAMNGFPISQQTHRERRNVVISGIHVPQRPPTSASISRQISLGMPQVKSSTLHRYMYGEPEVVIGHIGFRSWPAEGLVPGGGSIGGSHVNHLIHQRGKLNILQATRWLPTDEHRVAGERG